MYAPVEPSDEDHEQQELHRGEQPVVEQSAESENVSEPADAITVKVRSADEKTHEVRVSASETVLGLKRLLEARTNLPPVRQRLICLGRLLEDAQTLKQAGVVDGVFIHLVPKPAAAPRPCRSSSSSNGASDDDDRIDVHIDGDGGVTLPPHIQEMLAAQRANAISGPNRAWRHSRGTAADDGAFSFEDEYELSIWRYRVRVLSFAMLFYYFLSLMAALSLWMHPEAAQQQQGQFRQVKQDLPLTLVDLAENVLGIAVAGVGLRAAAVPRVGTAKRYLRELTTLALVHFCNLFMWIAALLRGEIVQIPPHHRIGRSHEEAAESLRSVVSALLIVHPMLWAAILTVAHRHYKLVALRSGADGSSASNRNNEDSDDNEDVPVAAPARDADVV